MLIDPLWCSLLTSKQTISVLCTDLQVPVLAMTWLPFSFTFSPLHLTMVLFMAESFFFFCFASSYCVIFSVSHPTFHRELYRPQGRKQSVLIQRPLLSTPCWATKTFCRLFESLAGSVTSTRVVRWLSCKSHYPECSCLVLTYSVQMKAAYYHQCSFWTFVKDIGLVHDARVLKNSTVLT